MTRVTHFKDYLSLTPGFFRSFLFYFILQFYHWILRLELYYLLHFHLFGIILISYPWLWDGGVNLSQSSFFWHFFKLFFFISSSNIRLFGLRLCYFFHFSFYGVILDRQLVELTWVDFGFLRLFYWFNFSIFF
jgi:hypothetical protein